MSGQGEDSFEALLREAARAPSLPLVDPLLGTQLGPYRVEARLGAGGMGRVYRAYDARLDRAVALKVVPPGRAAVHEARCAARVRHPNIATIHDVGQSADLTWIAFELVDGAPLDAWATQHVEGAARAGTLTLARGLASALAHLHQRGLVHGDLSPRNVLVTDEGPMLVDFGLSSETGAVRVAGTPGFIAPEVLAGGPRDARADVFAFGAVLGTLPTLPRRLKRLVRRCLSERPSHRPADGAALERALAPHRGRRRAALVFAALLALPTGALLFEGNTREPVRAPSRGAEVTPSREAERRLEPLTFNTERGGVLDACISPDGDRLALVDVAGAFVMHLSDGHRLPVRVSGEQGAIRGISWLGHDRLLLSAERGTWWVDLDGLADRPGVVVAGPVVAGPVAAEGRVIGSTSGVVLHQTNSAMELGRLVGEQLEITHRFDSPAGRLVASAFSPSGAQLAWIVVEGDGSVHLLLFEPSTGQTRRLVSDRRLVADSGGGALAFLDDEHLVVGLSAVPAQRLAAQLVSTPHERWSPRPVADLERFASHLSADRQGALVFVQSNLQSDTVIVPRQGDGFGPPEPVSLSARDDRPTDWTDAGGLIGMMRRGAEHRAVHIPTEPSTPVPIGPERWFTWPQQVPSGLVGFAPSTETGRVDWVLVEPAGRVREIGTVSERVGDEGTGRAVPRRAAFDCTQEGRCVLVELDEGMRLTLHEPDATSRVMRVPSDAQRIFGVAVNAAFTEVAVASNEGVGVVDLVGPSRGEVRRRWPSSERVVLQYLARDPGGWLATGIYFDAPRFRLVRLGNDGSVSTLLTDDHAWMANPTPSPDGTRLALAVMRLRSDVYRLAPPAD